MSFFFFFFNCHAVVEQIRKEAQLIKLYSLILRGATVPPECYLSPSCTKYCRYYASWFSEKGTSAYCTALSRNAGTLGYESPLKVQFIIIQLHICRETNSCQKQ